MTAVATPKVEAKDVVSRFVEDYARAMREAEVSQEHTATAGWQHLYAEARKGQQEEQRRLCKELESAAYQLGMIGPTEDNEKAVGEIKKSMAALRERIDGFELHTVAPVRAPVDHCKNVIQQYASLARRQQDDAPLHQSGLTDRMAKAIADASKVDWNEENGRVEIEE